MKTVRGLLMLLVVAQTVTSFMVALHRSPARPRERALLARSEATRPWKAGVYVLSLAFTMVCLNPPAEAAVAPLADVGLREFLVKDGGELLRLSLPSSMTKDAPINLEMDLGRQCQEALELVKLRLEQVGFSGKKPVWLASLKEVNEANRISNTDALLEKIPKKDMAEANRQLNLLKGSIDALRDAVRNEDIKSTIEVQDRAAKEVRSDEERRTEGWAEGWSEATTRAIPNILSSRFAPNLLQLYNLTLMAMKPGLPYSLPDDIAAGKPTLKGRATVELTIKRPSGAKPFELDDGTKSDQIPLTLIVVGYRAPVTAGNFVDLVNRKFYDNMPINSVDDLFVNCGKPDGGEGFVDPSSKEVRTIPLELFYKKDVTPVWHYR